MHVLLNSIFISFTFGLHLHHSLLVHRPRHPTHLRVPYFHFVLLDHIRDRLPLDFILANNLRRFLFIYHQFSFINYYISFFLQAIVVLSSAAPSLCESDSYVFFGQCQTHLEHTKSVKYSTSNRLLQINIVNFVQG